MSMRTSCVALALYKYTIWSIVGTKYGYVRKITFVDAKYSIIAPLTYITKNTIIINGSYQKNEEKEGRQIW